MIYQLELKKFNAEFTNTINPVVNFNLKGEVKHQPDEYQSSIQLIHGPDLSSKANILSVSHKIEKKWNGPGDFLYSEDGKITYPLVGLNFEYEFKAGPKTLEYEVNVQYNEIKFGSELELELNKKQSGDFDFEFGIYGLDNKVKVKAERVVQGETSSINNELEVNGKKIEVKGKIKHQFKSGNVDIGADLTVIVPTHPTPFKVNSGLKYSPNDYDAHHKVTSGSTVVIDAFIKGNKQGNANGSFKVNIKNYLVVNGQLKATKGVGTADLLIDAQKVKQKIKLDSSFKIQPPTVYNIDLTISPSFGTDNSQQIKISTHSKIDSNSLDSKSNINVLGKKLEFNFKGQKTGNEQSGNLNGELEITLANDLYLLGKVNSNRDYKDDFFNGDGLISLEYRKNKNTSGRKLSVNANYRNTNPQKGLYDIKYVISADDSNGQNINADIYYKRTKQGEQRVVELGNKIYGSLLKNTISGDLKAAYDKNNGQLDISTAYGTDLNSKVGGSYQNPGEGKPSSGTVYLQLTTPNKELKTLNLEFSGSVLKPTNPSERFEIRGSGKIFADDDGVINFFFLYQIFFK